MKLVYGYQLIEALNSVGPLPNTVNDFWWLVWQERVHIVAMVTNTVERGQQKCEQYWPDEGTKEYGPFKVTLADQQVFADYTIRQLFVSVSLMILQYTTSTLLHSSSDHFFFTWAILDVTAAFNCISVPILPGTVFRQRVVCDKLNLTHLTVLNPLASETPPIFLAMHIPCMYY